MSKDYYLLHKEEIIAKQKEYYQCNKDRIISQHKEYLQNKDKSEYFKEYYEKHKKEKIEKSKINYRENIDNIKIRKSKAYLNNKDGKIKEYKQINKEKIRKCANKYFKNRYENDYLFKLSSLLRGRIRDALIRKKGYTKRHSSNELLGCDFETVKIHLERKFIEGMTWELLGIEIHIDHIIPLASAKTENELLKLFHYTNLQPLWKMDNFKKGSKVLELN